MLLVLAFICSEPIITVFNPEPHILFTVTAGTNLDKPALNPACLAGAWPIPACNTQPIITSSISSKFTPESFMAFFIATPPNSGAESLANSP